MSMSANLHHPELAAHHEAPDYPGWIKVRDHNGNELTVFLGDQGTNLAFLSQLRAAVESALLVEMGLAGQEEAA